AKDKNGLPSFNASDGVNVTLGRLPGVTTLKGFSEEVMTKLCMRWLIPTPVFPAIQAGNQPPLGVMDTTQPSLSAASTDVVPNHILSMYNGSLNEIVVSCVGRKLRLPSADDCLFFKRSRYGFVFPSKGYGSPGPMFGSF